MTKRERYREYIQSPQWKATRRNALRRAGWRCEYRSPDGEGHGIVGHRCDAQQLLSAHHATYSRLGREVDGDLIVLCWKHHMLEHAVELCKCGECGGRSYDLYDEAESVVDRYLEAAELAERVRKGRIGWAFLPTKEQLAAILTQERPVCGLCQMGLKITLSIT